MVEVSTPFPERKLRRKKVINTKILIKSLVYAFAIFGLLFIIFLLSIIGLLRQETGAPAAVPSSAILTIDFDDDYSEVRKDNLLTEISETRSIAFYDLIKAINVAAIDKRIKVLVANIGISNLGIAQIQDLRKAIKGFRKTGKKAYMFSNGFGPLGQGTSEYYLAGSFDKIYMQPNSEVGITGIAIEVPFARQFLNKIGVFPEFYSRYEYKTAAASLTDAQMSVPFRRQLEDLGKSIFNQFISDISSDRNIEESVLRNLVNQAPLSAETALKNKLIDDVVYRQDLFNQLTKEYHAEEISVGDYISNFSRAKASKQIAFLVIDGTINDGKSIDNPVSGETVVGSETVVSQLEEIGKNSKIKALVVRVNSPGGSYIASKEIWHALNKLKSDKKIPIIVSMGDYAASGGYFVALAGDKIVAAPSTVTGSIGVLGGKLVFKDLWKKLDINWSEVDFGSNAGILSVNRTFSNQEKNIFNKSLDAIYEDFTLTVSQERNIPFDRVKNLAKGRVWSGEDAYKFKLIDDIGGIDKSLELAKELAAIASDEKYSIVYYPKPKTLQEKIMEVIKSSPSVSINQLKAQLGLENDAFSVLQRLKYNLALPPFIMNI